MQHGAIPANQGAIVPSGKAITSTLETVTSTVYTTLTTPDQVTGVVLPTDGLICVLYQAGWQESVSGAARAAVFIGANQLKVNDFTVPGPSLQAAATNSAPANIRQALWTAHAGLVSSGLNVNVAIPVTTGMAVGMRGNWASEYSGTTVAGSSSSIDMSGGPLHIFAAAGTYTVSIQFKSSSGTVGAQNRKLWVWTKEF
jgi:hypothetical protein